MTDLWGLGVSAKVFFHVMVSVAFIVGILLMVAPDVFQALNRILQKEYGMRKRVAPKLEETQIDVIERVALKNRVLTGVALAVISFVLLLILK